MNAKFVDPLDQFVVKHLLIVSNDEAAASRIILFAAQLKGSHRDQRIETAAVDTIKKARDYIKSNRLNIIVIDPAVEAVNPVLNFVREIRETYKHIVWVVFSNKSWLEQNKKTIQSHPWGRRFSKYYKLYKKDLSGDDAYRNFVLVLTMCHWDFVLQLLSDATKHIEKDASSIMTPDQVGKFIEKGMAPLQSLSREQSKKGRDVFVSMNQSGGSLAQYRVAIQGPLKTAGYNSFFAGDAQIEGQIPDEIFARIRASGLFIADLTGLRPSVLIELGYALALGIPRILVRDTNLSDRRLPFVIRGLDVPPYVGVDSLKDLVRRRLEQLG